jgi:hypothetical protein
MPKGTVTRARAAIFRGADRPQQVVMMGDTVVSETAARVTP